MQLGDGCGQVLYLFRVKDMNERGGVSEELIQLEKNLSSSFCMAAKAVCISDVAETLSTAVAAGKLVKPAAAGVIAFMLRSEANMKVLKASYVCCSASGWNMKNALRRSFKTKFELTAVEKCANRVAEATWIL